MDYLDSRFHIFKYYKLILQKKKKKILNLVCFFQNSLDAWVHLSPSRIWSRGMNWSREICEFVSNLNNLGWEIRNQIGLHKTKPWLLNLIKYMAFHAGFPISHTKNVYGSRLSAFL